MHPRRLLVYPFLHQHIPLYPPADPTSRTLFLPLPSSSLSPFVPSFCPFSSGPLTCRFLRSLLFNLYKFHSRKYPLRGTAPPLHPSSAALFEESTFRGDVYALNSEVYVANSTAIVADVASSWQLFRRAEQTGRGDGAEEQDRRHQQHRRPLRSIHCRRKFSNGLASPPSVSLSLSFSFSPRGREQPPSSPSSVRAHPLELSLSPGEVKRGTPSPSRGALLPSLVSRMNFC